MKKVMPTIVGYDPYSSLYAGYGFTPAVAAVSPALAPYYATQAALATPAGAAGVVASPAAAAVSYYPAVSAVAPVAPITSLGLQV
jgi:hypothetical protein